MSYHEEKSNGLVTVRITCDARKGKGICGNSAGGTMQHCETIQRFLYRLGWRLLRGHQVCSSCLAKGKVVFPRRAA